MDEYIIELRRYLNTYNEKDFDELFRGFLKNGKSVYYDLFKEPVNRVFYCCENDYSGSIFVIWEYCGIYIVSHGFFGSCGVCDPWEETESLDILMDKLERVFSSLEYYNSIDQIELHQYYADYIIKKFYDFKMMDNPGK